MTKHSLFVYVGTFSEAGSMSVTPSTGIFIFRLSLEDGSLSLVGTASETLNTSFLTIDLPHHCLYVANEVNEFMGQYGGVASAFAIHPRDGTLTFLNHQSTHGGASCYASTDQDHRFLLVANYFGASVSVFPILANGELAPLSGFRQLAASSVNLNQPPASTPHSIIMDNSNRFALVADSSADKILVFLLDKNSGQLTPNAFPWVKVRPGAGPRHMVFDKSGHFLYTTNERNSTVGVFAWDGVKGTLNEIQTLPMLPENFKDPNLAADIHLTPSGKFLYASNRGHDSLVIYSVEPQSGLLTFLGHVPTHGQVPRNFAIDPTGTYLVVGNQISHNLVTFRIDPDNGRLVETGNSAEVLLPVCVQIVDLHT